MNFADDNRFFTYSFTDETSQFDSEGYWAFGFDCFMRKYYCRIPIRIKNNRKLIDRFIDKYNEREGFWVDGPTHSNAILSKGLHEAYDELHKDTD